MIGQPGFGLSLEARKSVAIGIELAAAPVIGEPTSGLDGQSTCNIVRFLKKLAPGSQAILHHPAALRSPIRAIQQPAPFPAQRRVHLLQTHWRR
jgi:hypothetical protein